MAMTTVELKQHSCVLRHSEIRHGRRSILLLHGLGDSSLAFEEIFTFAGFESFNLLAPDLPGFGESAQLVGKAPTFDEIVAMLGELLTRFGGDEVLLIGHSLGGGLGSLLCAADGEERIKGYINVEGNLTHADLFLSGQAVAHDKIDDFHDWFDRVFRRERKWRILGRNSRSTRRYFKSLAGCNPDVFLAMSHELVERGGPSEEHPVSELADLYLSLTLPRLFCYGGQSCPQETEHFLKSNNLDRLLFIKATHGLMIDETEMFYTRVLDFAREIF
ncbi:MAG: alpha/beta hydrolase [bacterium]|nr:alpha/beta hydrolase [bacterium]